MTLIYSQVQNRIISATEKYGQIRSTHEALGVLLEEMYELTEAIHANDRHLVREEALDISAAAFRLAQACSDADYDFRERSGFA